MEVLDEVALDKHIMLPEKETGTKQPWNKIYEVIYENYFEQTDLRFSK